MILGWDIRIEYHKGYGPPRIRIKKMDKHGKRVEGGTLVRCRDCGDGFLLQEDQRPPAVPPLRVV